MTDLKDKAIQIQGRDYVLVKDRILAFNEEYKNGSIVTNLISYESGQAVVKAKVTPDIEKPERYFTGYSQAVDGQGYINKTAALENAESSAVGRALAMMGIGIIDSIASVDEMRKAGVAEQGKPATIVNPVNHPDGQAIKQAVEEDAKIACEVCGKPAIEKKGITKGGKQYHGVFCSTEDRSHTRWLWN